MGNLFINTGLSPIYDIEMKVKCYVFLEFCVFLDNMHFIIQRMSINTVC